MNSKIVVGMADLKVSKGESVLTTLGLGSCVGIALFDVGTKVAGLAHCMLPDSSLISNNQNVAKFVDTATIRLVNDMVKLGARKTFLKAKIAGGAQMFELSSGNESMKIGDRNIEATIKLLRQMGIPIVGRDTGSNYGRTVELFAGDGKYLIKTIGQGNKYI